jgi:hypothetical protein
MFPKILQLKNRRVELNQVWEQGRKEVLLHQSNLKDLRGVELRHKKQGSEKIKKRLETPIEEEDKPVPQVKVVEKDRIIEKGYSQKDLDDAVARAVEQSVNRVETLRKQRKEVKKKAEAKAKHDEKVFQEVNRALKNDVWANCFL